MEVEIEPSTSTTNANNLSAPARVILPTSYQFMINSEDLHRLNEMRQRFYKKELERKSTKLNLDEQKSIRHRDMEWLSIVLPFVRKYNPHCGICASSKNYGRRLDTANSYLIRSYFYCQGQDCPFNCIVTIKENGNGLLCARSSNGNLVDHRNAKRVGRPNRSLNKSNRRLKRSKTSTIIQQWNRTVNDNLNFFDQDSIESKKYFLESCANLLQLMKNLRQDIEPSGLIQGALQQISLEPFHVTIHTEKSIRYYHSSLTRQHTPLPPTVYAIAESIEFENKNFIYYELMLSNHDDTSMIPITLAYTAKTDDFQSENYILKSWFERFRFDYEYLYKSQSKPYTFSHPSIILVDDHRETPLNNSLLQFFNGETFKEYIMRTYSCEQINDRCILHVSSSIIFVEFRTLVNKYVSIELRHLALWSSLILIYSSTWHDIRQNWSLICEIFLNWGTNYVSLKSYEQLCTNVAQIENNPDLTHLLDLTYINNHSDTNENYEPSIDDDDDDDMNEDIIDLSDFQNDHFYTKNMITNESNHYVSPYENDLRVIFNEKNQSKTALTSSWETLSDDDRNIFKKIKGNSKWLYLLLKDYLPTIPLWSNFILNQYQHKYLAKLFLNKTQRLNQVKQINIHDKFDLVIENLVKDLQIQVANADMK